ncbi:hypothetical protein [Metallosphaera hakonensis]|uniref:hypothetical protein n=1 Tax=Metallosphaera hakonensis TaxID=79601 RepID=UPI000ADD70A9|nr:hypothetical protein [Metallosphaera hakonensis]
MTENEKDKKQANVTFISFPSKEIFDEIYNELNEDGKKELDSMMKEGRVKIY